ncbi:MAG: hypothetical protein ACR2PM_13030 [Hyphomicrobiales bacterium]
MAWMELLEALSYGVTILGFPLAIGVLVHQQREQRQNEENALHRMLSEEYDVFVKLTLEHSDLLLMRRGAPQPELTPEQQERRHILFSVLTSLFEKAYIIMYSQHMTRDTTRLWLSWEDDMREWCAREDFRSALPELLEGEDDEFSEHIRAIAAEEEAAARP